MARPTTPSIAQQRNKLTTRQDLDARSASLAYGSKLMTRMARFAIGGKTGDDGIERDEEGKEIKAMSAAQIRAAETVLRKILPDLSSVQELPVDAFEGMSRGEMLDMLGSMIASNSHLLKNPDIQDAVNKSQTVIELIPGKSADDD